MDEHQILAGVAAFGASGYVFPAAAMSLPLVGVDGSSKPLHAVLGPGDVHTTILVLGRNLL